MQSACIEIDFRTQSVSEVSATSREATCPPENGQSQAVFPARIFPSLVKALGWMVADQDYGSSMPESLASYDLDSQSWKTSALSLFGDSIEFSGALPKSGMMRNGKIYALPMSARPIDGNESGLLPTPTKSDCAARRPSKNWDGNDLPSVMWVICGGKENLSKPPLKLHPEFVEWLMGYPLGWTDLNASVTR